MKQHLEQDNLLPLFEAFSLKCRQLQHAINVGDDQLVRLLDRELEPLIAAVVDHRAETPDEVHRQLRFLNGLIREDADDRSCVLRHSAMLSVLLDRYFGHQEPSVGRMPVPGAVDSGAAPAQDDAFLNETVLNCLPDMVAVVTADHRYLYSNPAHARHFDRMPFDFVGRHLSEFVGAEMFETAFRARLDRCLRGDVVESSWLAVPTRAAAGFHCRMTPLRGRRDEIIGAILIMREAPCALRELAA